MQFRSRTPNLWKKIGVVSILLAMCISLGTGIRSIPVASQPTSGGTMIVEQPEDITHLMQDVEPGGAWYADYALFDRLIEVDADTAEVIPGLAETWDVTPDGLGYKFHMFENVKWHDGTPFSAEDVEYTYNYIKDNDLWGASYLDSATNIEATDANTLVITLDAPNAAFISQLGTWSNALCIVPKHIYDNGEPWEENDNIYAPIGTGPFKFDEYRPGEFARLVRYDDYHKGTPYLDALVWQIVPDVSVAMQMLKTNELSLVGAGSAPPFSELESLDNTPGISVRGAPLGGEDMFSLEFNVGDMSKPFHLLDVRKAIAMAIDRDELEDKVFFDYTKPAQSIFTEDIAWAFNPDAKYPAYDPAAAEALLDAAGYPRGIDDIRFHTKIEFGNYFGPQNEGLAAVISEQLAEIGIEVEYTLYEWLNWYQKVKLDHDFDMSIFLDYSGPDPDQLRYQVTTDASMNGGLYSNAQVDELFDLARKVSDRSERAVYYYEIQEILAEELPYLGLVDQDWYYAVRDEFKDLWFDEGVEATRLDPWTTWQEMAVDLFPSYAIFALAAVAPVLVVSILIVRRRYT